MISAARAHATIPDARTFPRSRNQSPVQFRHTPHELAPQQIGNSDWPDLGGRGSGQDSVPPTINDLWKNRSFHNDADSALKPRLQSDLDRLIEFPMHRHPLSCAHKLIARYIVVIRIMGEGKFF